MAERFRDEERQRAYRSGYDEGSDFERGTGFGERPRYDYGRYGGRGPRSDYEFGGGGFQRFGDPYGYESEYARAPEGYRAFSPRSRYEEESLREFGSERPRGNFRGVGPKGYVRSDERIREDVCDRLTDDPSLDASEIDVKVSNCEVTLQGTVDSRDEKRSTEDWAEAVAGVRHVQNNLRIEQTANAPGMAGTTTGAREVGTTSGTAGGNVTGTVAGTERAKTPETV